MKEVIAVYQNNLFKQFLKKSEVRLLIQMMNDLGKITINTVQITAQQYKIEFGL